MNWRFYVRNKLPRKKIKKDSKFSQTFCLFSFQAPVATMGLILHLVAFLSSICTDYLWTLDYIHIILLHIFGLVVSIAKGLSSGSVIEHLNSDYSYEMTTDELAMKVLTDTELSKNLGWKLRPHFFELPSIVRIQNMLVI